MVPPHTDPEIAHEAMMTAAKPDDVTSVSDLLAVGAPAGAQDGVHDGETPNNDYHRPTYRRRIRRFRA